MVGLGETYIPAFALAVGLGPAAAGLVATVPLVLGAALQMAGPAAARRTGSLRRFVVACSVLQALCFLPLAAGAILGGFPLVPLFAVVAVYWGAGYATGPAWTTWIETLVPSAVRARYFGRRGIVTNGALLLAIVAGGEVLEAAKGRGLVPGAFAVLFLGAGIGRIVSARFLHLHREVWVPRFEVLPLRAFLSRLRSSPAGRLLLGLSVLQAAVYVAWPFTAPYALDSLRFSYREYMVLVAVSYLSRMAAGPLLARAADRWGPRALLLATAAAMVPIHGLWILSPSLPWLVAVQALWGILLGALDLSTLMLYFGIIPREERVAVLAWFNLVVAAALAGGSLAGAFVLERLGGGREAYHALFLASTALRVAGVALLLRVPRS
jgi:MFS family permease